MGKVLQFTVKPPAKFGFERVKKRKKAGPEKPGQLNLFSSSGAQVLRLPTNISPFEEALLLDERGDQRAEEIYLRAIEEGDSTAIVNVRLRIENRKVTEAEWYLARENDPDGLTASVRTLYEHPEAWGPITRGARTLIEQEYDIDKQNDVLVRIYREVIAGAPQ